MKAMTKFSLLAPVALGLAAPSAADVITLNSTTVSGGDYDPVSDAGNTGGTDVTLTAVGGSNPALVAVATGVGVNNDEDDAAGGAARQNRIDSALYAGESIELVFSQDVTIHAVTAEAFQTGKRVTLSSSAFDGATGYDSGGFSFDDVTDTITFELPDDGGLSLNSATYSGSALSVPAGTVVTFGGADNGSTLRPGGVLLASLDITPVPEPASAALAVCGLLAVVRRRRRA